MIFNHKLNPVRGEAAVISARLALLFHGKYGMETAKLSSKSQITVPRKVREHLRIARGDRIGFEATADGRFIIGKAAPIHQSDGAARRRLHGKVVQAPAAIAETLTRTVTADDQRIRDGR